MNQIGHNGSDTQSLTDYARRMRNLVEEDMRIAADLRELAKEMRGVGYQASVLKGIVKALVSAENGDEKPLANLKARTQEIAMYADALGTPIDGFGERNQFGVNDFPAAATSMGIPMDPETGEIIEQEHSGHRHGSGKPTIPTGDAETRAVVEAPLISGAGAGDRPMRAARPDTFPPFSPSLTDEELAEIGEGIAVGMWEVSDALAPVEVIDGTGDVFADLGVSAPPPEPPPPEPDYFEIPDICRRPA